MKIITRKQAVQEGLRYYFTGVPCKNNHVSKRIVQNGTCYECAMIRNKVYADKNAGKFDEYKKEWYIKNKEYIKLYGKKYREENKEKIKKRNSDYIERSKVRISQYRRKTKYGLSEEDYQQLLEDCKGVCSICHQQETIKNAQGEIKKLAIDHCHMTNKVRGLLCDRCNVGLGCFKDSIKFLQNAINYLES